MSSPYTNYLHLKTTLQELPKSFVNKLNESEKAIFGELMNTIESTLPAKKSQPKPQRKVVIPGTFQPRIVILCLNLKNVINQRRYRLKRFSFALIRCLYKEAQRLETKKEPRRQSKNESYPDIPPSEPQDTGSALTKLKSELELKKRRILSGTFKVINSVKEKNLRNSIFSRWKKEAIQINQKKKHFAAMINSVYRGFMGKYLRVFFRKVQNKKVAGKLLKNALVLALYKRMSPAFSVVVRAIVTKEVTVVKESNAVQRKVNLNVETCEFIPVMNFRSSALTETVKNVPKSRAKAPAKPVAVDDENIEDFSYTTQRSTKMIKKKKQLLGRSKDVAKLDNIKKNHQWVQAFSLLKWKKLYFSTRTSSQHIEHVAVTVIQLLAKTFEKLAKHSKQLFFKQLKSLYSSMYAQGKLMNTSLGLACVNSFFNKKWLLFKLQAFHSLSATFASRSPSVGTQSIGAQSDIDILEKKTFYFYKKLKSAVKKIQLKKKIIAFISMQNFFDTKNDRTLKTKLNSLFQILHKLHFSHIYCVFQDIREKAVVSMIRSQAFYFIIVSVIERKAIMHQKQALAALKASYYGRVFFLVMTIEDRIRKSSMRVGVEGIVNYFINLSRFRLHRAGIAKKVWEKVYFKRLSSCFLKWQECVDDYWMAVELGFVSTADQSSRFEFASPVRYHSLSQDTPNEINYFLPSHSRFYSEILKKEQKQIE